jgi:Transposase IS116/IS110/IS902 family
MQGLSPTRSGPAVISGELAQTMRRQLRFGSWSAVVVIFSRSRTACSSRARKTSKSALWLLSKYVSPTEIRQAGRTRIVKHLRRGGQIPRHEQLADRAIASAGAQRISVPREKAMAGLIRELATEALATRARTIAIDQELEALIDRHPDGALIRSLPGMGVVLAAGFIAAAGSIDRFRSADALAAAAGLAPVLQQFGKMRYFRRPRGGDKHLKRVFYQSAYCSLSTKESRAFYDRKRREGKRHQQALIAPPVGGSMSSGRCSEAGHRTRPITDRQLDNSALSVRPAGDGYRFNPAGMQRLDRFGLWIDPLMLASRQTWKRQELTVELRLFIQPNSNGSRVDVVWSDHSGQVRDTLRGSQVGLHP